MTGPPFKQAIREIGVVGGPGESAGARAVGRSGENVQTLHQREGTSGGQESLLSIRPASLHKRVLSR